MKSRLSSRTFLLVPGRRYHTLFVGLPAAVAVALIIAATVVLVLLPAAAFAAVSPSFAGVGSWTVLRAEPADAVTSVVADAGKVVWGEFSVAGPNTVEVTSHIKLYDSASGQLTTLLTTPTQVQFCQLHGDHLLYGLYHSIPDNAPSDLILRSLSSESTKKLSTDGWDPHYSLLTGNSVIWDEMRWTADGELMPRNVKLYDIASGTTSDVTEITSRDEYFSILFADDAWVIWAYASTREAPHTLWAYSINTKQKTQLPGLAQTSAKLLSSNTLYHLSQSAGVYELRAYDLATGKDSVVISRPREIQSVAIDGDHFAWVEWDGGPFVVYFDRSSGQLTRIASPAYTVGTLTLKGDVLLWKGDIDHFQYTHNSNHQLFAFDVGKGTVTRLSATQSQARTWATDGEVIAANFAFSDLSQVKSQVVVFTRNEAADAGFFADVAGTHPYWTAINGLKDLGAVEGYPRADGSHVYSPDASLTRGQFAKMLVKALPVLSNGDYVSTLARLGIFQGTASGALLPFGTLTRAQMITLTVRAADKLRPGLLPQIALKDFPGVLGPFDPSHAHDVARAQWGGLLVGLAGYSKSWDAWRAASRAEAAQVLWNLTWSVRSPDITPPQSDHGGSGTPEYDGIPRPIVDGAVEGWYTYLGDGRFLTEFGREFSWHNGRFVNPDGTLMEIPASAKAHLKELGIERQPTIPYVLAPDRAELAGEVERIRKGLIAGTLAFDWAPPKDSDFPSDPLKVLESLEDSAYAPDAQVFLKDSAGYATALGKEIEAMPEVQQVEFVSKERALTQLRMQFKNQPEILSELQSNPLPASFSIWLNDHRQSSEFVKKLEGRPEVEDVKARSIDFAYWAGLLRDMTHATR